MRPECNAKLGFASSQRLSETEAHDERLADDVAGMAEVTNSADEVRACIKDARRLLRRDATQRPTFARLRSCQLAAARTATMADLVRSGRGGVPLLVAIYLGLR